MSDCYDRKPPTPRNPIIVAGELAREGRAEAAVIIRDQAVEIERLRSMQKKNDATIVLLFDWAMIWHRQAGGYTASDTTNLIMKAEKLANEIIDRNPDLECFRKPKRGV